MKIIVDTNVVLDLFLDRKPFVDEAANLFSMVEGGKIEGCLCATTITTIFYLIAKVKSSDKAKDAISSLLAIFKVAPVDGNVLNVALKSGFGDFEDAVIFAAAQQWGADLIVTRNERDFINAALPVHSPSEAIKFIDMEI